MSKNLSMEHRIKNLRVGQHFHVSTESERQHANRVAKILKRGGFIEFDVVTKADGDKFKVAAI